MADKGGAGQASSIGSKDKASTQPELEVRAPWRNAPARRPPACYVPSRDARVPACPTQVHALHRKRALAIGVVHHWAYLVGVGLLGSAWCAAVCSRAARVQRSRACLCWAQAVARDLLDHPRVRLRVRLRRGRQTALQPGRIHHGGMGATRAPLMAPPARRTRRR